MVIDLDESRVWIWRGLGDDEGLYVQFFVVVTRQAYSCFCWMVIMRRGVCV